MLWLLLTPLAFSEPAPVPSPAPEPLPAPAPEPVPAPQPAPRGLTGEMPWDTMPTPAAPPTVTAAPGPAIPLPAAPAPLRLPLVPDDAHPTALGVGIGGSGWISADLQIRALPWLWPEISLGLRTLRGDKGELIARPVASLGLVTQFGRGDLRAGPFLKAWSTPPVGPHQTLIGAGLSMRQFGTHAPVGWTIELGPAVYLSRSPAPEASAPLAVYARVAGCVFVGPRVALQAKHKRSAISD